MMVLEIREIHWSLSGVLRYGVFLDGSRLSGNDTCTTPERAFYAAHCVRHALTSAGVSVTFTRETMRMP